MKSKHVIAALATIAMCVSGMAGAQGAPERGDRGTEGARSGQNKDMNSGQRGAGPNHSFHKGDRLPAENHRPQDVVGDWKGHHLSAPPHGYHWVQSGGDYVLVAIATGVILQTLLSN